MLDRRVAMRHGVPNDLLLGGGNLMKKFLKPVVALGAVVLALAAGPAVRAQECPENIFYWHGWGGSLTGLPEAWVAGNVSEIGNPAANSGTAAFICTNSGGGTPGIDVCQSEAGPANAVTLNGDWNRPGTAGCPVNTFDAQGSHPIVGLITSSEGEGTTGHQGKYSIIAVGFSAAYQFYTVDYADPNFNVGSGTSGPLGSANFPALHVASVQNLGNG